MAFSFSAELEQFFLEDQGGRFLPVFWLYHALIYRIIGPNPFLAFVVQSGLFLTLTAGLIRLVRFRGGSNLQAGAAGLFFVLSGPIIENFYTLGKTEPPQLLGMGLSVAFIIGYRRVRPLWQKISLLFFSVTALLLAIMIKETAVVLIPIGLGWLLVGWVKQDGRLSANQAIRWAYLGVSLISVALFFGIRAFFVPVSLAEGSNTSAYHLAWYTMATTASQAAGWILRDFIFLFPLVIFMGLLFVLKMQPQSRLILDTLVWMLGWMAIYLPWQLALEYYLLPFAAGAAVLGGVGFGQALAYMRSTRQDPLFRVLAGVCVGLALAPWPLLLANNFTNGQLQIAIDEANADFLDFVATLPPDKKVMVNLAPINEYVIKTEPLLAITRNRADLAFDYFKFQTASPAEPALDYYIAAPYIRNQTFPTVRVAMTEGGTALWDQALSKFLEPNLNPIYATERELKLLDFGLHRLICPLVEGVGLDGLFCFPQRPLVDTRALTYGWNVYPVSSHLSAMALPAVFLPEGVWHLRQADGQFREIKFGQAGDIPLAEDWNGDGYSELGFFRPENLTWYLDRDFDGKADGEFQFAGMRSGDIPFAGDWDGDGAATPGYFRPSDASWHFSNSQTSWQEDLPPLQLGSSSVVPLVGDWNGDARDTIGFYQPGDGAVALWNSPTQQLLFSVAPQASPAVGDWSGRGVDTLALVSKGRWHTHFIHCNCTPSNPIEPYDLGLPHHGIPLAGIWPMGE